MQHCPVESSFLILGLFFYPLLSPLPFNLFRGSLIFLLLFFIFTLLPKYVYSHLFVYPYILIPICVYILMLYYPFIHYFFYSLLLLSFNILTFICFCPLFIFYHISIKARLFFVTILLNTQKHAITKSYKH